VIVQISSGIIGVNHASEFRATEPNISICPLYESEERHWVRRRCKLLDRGRDTHYGRAASLARMTVCLLVPYRFASAETLVPAAICSRTAAR
jgi:hypothetical protein